MGSFALQRMDTHRDHELDAVAFVEAGILPASEGGILPPGWKPGLTGSQGWLPPQARFMEGRRRPRSSAVGRRLPTKKPRSG